MYAWLKNNRSLLPYIPLLFIASTCFFFLFSLFTPPVSVLPFTPRVVSPFSLSSLSKEKNASPFTDKDLKQNLSLVHVWSSWNKASQENHAYFMQLSKVHRLPLYGIIWHDTEEAVLSWLKTHGNPYQKIGLDEKGLVSVDLGVKNVPDSFLIDASGMILMHFSGALTKEVQKTLFHVNN